MKVKHLVHLETMIFSLIIYSLGVLFGTNINKQIIIISVLTVALIFIYYISGRKMAPDIFLFIPLELSIATGIMVLLIYYTVPNLYVWTPILLLSAYLSPIVLLDYDAKKYFEYDVLFSQSKWKNQKRFFYFTSKPKPVLVDMYHNEIYIYYNYNNAKNFHFGQPEELAIFLEEFFSNPIRAIKIYENL
jgi:hypothetical protein